MYMHAFYMTFVCILCFLNVVPWMFPAPHCWRPHTSRSRDNYVLLLDIVDERFAPVTTPDRADYVAMLVDDFLKMRYEAKHRYFKQLARVTGNFKNMPKTLAERHQHYMCYLLMEPSTYMKTQISYAGGKLSQNST